MGENQYTRVVRLALQLVRASNNEFIVRERSGYRNIGFLSGFPRRRKPCFINHEAPLPGILKLYKAMHREYQRVPTCAVSLSQYARACSNHR